MTTNSGIRRPKQIKGLLDYVFIDLGTGGLRMACSIEGDEDCREIGNYPGAQAGTPSLVSQAPTNIIYELNGDEPAKPVAFGYVKPRRRQKLVSGVKIALLPDPESYGYAYAALVEAANDLNLRSVQQIPEDFLRFAMEHAIKECGGQQPTKGWVFSVPQYYKIEEVQNFRALIQKAGCLGNIYIHGESDCVAYANLPTIEDIISDAKESVFKKKQNYTIAVGIFDLGAGTTDITTSEICFKYDGGPPAINELSAPLGFAIGGDSFDERFIDLLRAKLDINMTPDKEQAFFNPFVNHFHLQSKPQWTTDFEDEEYPFSVPYGKDQFVLTKEDMTYIMEPPIDETCRRIGEHLAQIIRPLDLVVISGGNSEVPGIVHNLCAMLKEKNIISNDEKVIHLVGQSLNAVIHGLHYWIKHPQLVRGRYARMTLGRVVKRPCTELNQQIKVPAKDAELPKFYDCAERIITEGILVPDGIQTVDIYFDIDINAKNLNLLPIDICIPNKDAETYTSENRLWNFASECRIIGALHLESKIMNIDIGALRKVATKGLRRLWLRLSIEVDIDINIVVSWRSDGCKLKEDTEFCSTKLTLESVNLSGQRLVDEFRAPIQQRESSNSNITNDTLPNYLQTLKAIDEIKTFSKNLSSTSIPFQSDSFLPERNDVHFAAWPRDGSGKIDSYESITQAAPYCPENPAVAYLDSERSTQMDHPNRKRTFSETEIGYGYPIPSQSYSAPDQDSYNKSLLVNPSFYSPSISHLQDSHLQRMLPSSSTATTFASSSSSNPLYHRHQISSYTPQSLYPSQSFDIYDENTLVNPQDPSLNHNPTN